MTSIEVSPLDNVLVNIYDLDNTLGYPSPYDQFSFVKNEYTEKIMNSVAFINQLIDSQVARWFIRNKDVLFRDRLTKQYIITGRGEKMYQATLTWLQIHHIFMHDVKFVGYIDYETYIMKKKKMIAYLINKTIDDDTRNLLKKKVRYFDDCEDLCNWFFQEYGERYNADVYLIKDGEILKKYR